MSTRRQDGDDSKRRWATNRKPGVGRADQPDAAIEAAHRERLAAVGRVAATIAHEMGTPLNSVLGYTQLLMREEPDEQRREKLAIIESQIERIIETIRGVLDRTRGHAAPHRLVAIDEVIDQVGQALSPQIMEKAIELRIEMPDDPPTIHTDFIAIRQTLINLLSNAIDATPESGTITIEVIVNTDESCLDLTIADTGPGVPAVERERIFDPLYTTKGDGDGTGLGLSIVQWLVRDLGGAVSLDENVECGAVFRVRLPLRD